MHARFQEAFGDPHAREGNGANWSLASASSNGPPVHVIVTGWATGPCVWVFDPHDRTNGVKYQMINDIAQIDGAIAGIRSRIHLPPTSPDAVPGPAPGQATAPACRPAR